MPNNKGQEFEFEDGACLLVIRHALCVTADELIEMDKILDGLEKQQFKLYGKTCTMHRKQLMFGGKPYKFSRVVVPAHEGDPPALVRKCMETAGEIVADTCGCVGGTMNMNAALGVLYGPDDYISPHSDDEPEHSPGSPIVGFSFGETRKLVIKRKGLKRRDKEYMQFKTELPAGSAYVMYGRKFQENYTHEVGKGKGTRLSVTVRNFFEI